jgi:hypothetical protein
VRAQPLQNLIKVRIAGLSAQGSLPVCEDMKLLSAESSRICNLAHPISHTRSADRNSIRSEDSPVRISRILEVDYDDHDQPQPTGRSVARIPP